MRHGTAALTCYALGCFPAGRRLARSLAWGRSDTGPWPSTSPIAQASRAKAGKKAGRLELTEEQKAEIKEAFDLFDTDGSGELGADPTGRRGKRGPMWTQPSTTLAAARPQALLTRRS
jgi:hypothetical protein